MLVIKLWGECAKFSRATGEWTCRDADVLYYLKLLKEHQVFLREVMPYFWEIEWELEQVLLDELSGGEEDPPIVEVIAWVFEPLKEVEHCWLTPREWYGGGSHE